MSGAPAVRKTAIALLFAMFLSVFGPIGPFNPATSASASSVDFSGEYLNFDASTMVVLNGATTSPTVGLTLLYPSAGVIEGVSVDVTVEMIAVTNSNNASFDWDPPTDSQFNNVALNQDQEDLIILDMGNSGKPIEIVLRFRFWESGTVAYVSSQVSGVAVELRNLLLNTYDLDANQYVAFSGFQSYDLDSSTSVTVSQIAGTRLVKFLGPSGGLSGTNSFTIGRARVVYDQVSSVDVQIFAPSSALYGLQFGAGVAWPSSVRASNTFNAAPTSSDTTKYVVTGSPSVLNLSDFGPYSDPDSNPFFDVKFEASSDLSGLQLFDGSSTISPAAGSTVSVQAITSGRLSYLLPASSPATVSFRVGDGLTYSAAVYSLNLLPALAPQVITFPERQGAIDPNSGAFSSSATTSSLLPLTLTSNTPNVCSTVNNSDIVPLITSSRTACSVTATQEGDSNFASAEPVTRVFYFSNQEISFSPIANQPFVASATISSGAFANSTLPVTLTSITNGVCTVSGLDIEFVSEGTCTVRAEQNGGQTGSPLVTYISAFPVVRSFTLTSVNLPATPTGDPSGQPPVYNGPVITLVSPNVVSTDGGSLVKVTGMRLGTGQHVVLDGKQLPLISSSPTEFTFLMPKTEAGVWDLLYVYDGGARITVLRAITSVSKGNAALAGPGSGSTLSPEQNIRPWSAKDVASKFSPGSPVINRWVRAEVILMLRKYSSIATHVDCTGFTMGPSVLRVDAKLSRDRAVAVCGLIKQLRPRLQVISVQGKQELRLGGEIRRVEVQFYRR